VRSLLLATVIFASACGSHLAAEPSSAPASPTRIVSLAPSLTEMIFALGCGSRLVGRTRFAEWPTEVESVAVVGGFLDPSWEAIVALDPDLVVLSPYGDAARRLEQLGIPSATYHHGDIAGVLDTLNRLASTLGIPERGAAEVARLERALGAARSRAQGRMQPRTLVIIGRTLDDGSELQVAGSSSFVGELLALVGGVNVADELVGEYPTIGTEGLLQLAPQLILELDADAGADESRSSPWPALAAESAPRYQLLTHQALVIPGPRLDQALALLEAAVVEAAVIETAVTQRNERKGR
jgi:iron complex transport system substrate-binding protein